MKIELAKLYKPLDDNNLTLSEKMIKHSELFENKQYSHMIQLYLNYYNITDTKTYFNNDFNIRANSMDLKDLPILVNKLYEIIENNEADKLLLVADYDTDGITAATVFYLFMLMKFNIKFDIYIPERIQGYGLSKAIVEYASEHNKKYIVTVDNGIAAFEAIDYANELGIDILITDHHSVQNNRIPNAKLCVNPAQSDCMFSDKKLSGVGVIWNVLSQIDFDIAYQLLPFVMIGTIADVVPLQNQNRLYVKEGLKICNTSKIPSLLYLKNALQIDEFTSTDVGFKIAPHINSAGRMGLAYKSFLYLIETDETKLKLLWDEIVELNKDRKEKQKAMEEIINKKMEIFDFENNKSILIYPETFEEDRVFDPSVAGIVASKIVEKYKLPTIILGYKNIIENYTKLKKMTWYKLDKYKISLSPFKVMDFNRQKLAGSARGVFWFNFIELIEKLKAKSLLYSGGGHKLAAGLTVYLDKVKDLNVIFNEIAINNYQEPLPLEVLNVFKLTNNKNESKQFLNSLLKDFELLKPFGEANPSPNLAFSLENYSDYKIKGSSGEHISLRIGGIVANGWFLTKDSELLELASNNFIIATPELSSFKNENDEVIKFHQLNIKQFVKFH